MKNLRSEEQTSETFDFGKPRKKVMDGMSRTEEKIHNNETISL